ncbi:MAG: hypothetical protein V4484_02805 [Pseudomonadota bacterium]
MNHKILILFLLSVLQTNASLAGDKNTSAAKSGNRATKSLCFRNEQGFSLGAVVWKNEKVFRCTEVFGPALENEAQSAWVELNESLMPLKSAAVK